MTQITHSSVSSSYGSRLEHFKLWLELTQGGVKLYNAAPESNSIVSLETAISVLYTATMYFEYAMINLSPHERLDFIQWATNEIAQSKTVTEEKK